MYSLLISLLSQLIIVIEFALSTVTMGDHLWTILNRLEELTKQHRNRLVYERENGIREENPNLFVLDHLNISLGGVPNAPLLQSAINLMSRDAMNVF